MRKRVDRSLWIAMAPLLSIILMLAGCGGSGQPFTAGGGVPQGEEPQPVVLSSTTARIDAAQGATIRLGEASVTIPPNALTESAEVTVSLLDRPSLRPRNQSFESSGPALQIESQATFRGDFEGDIEIEFQGGEGDLITLTRDDDISVTLQINDPVTSQEVRPQLGALKNLVAKAKAAVVTGAKKVVVAVYRGSIGSHNDQLFLLNSSWQRVAGGRYAVVIHGINSSAADQRIRSLTNAIEGFGLYDGVARFQYDFTLGPEAPARQLANNLRTFLPGNARVDIYAHSFGGIVSRYYLQRVDVGNSPVQRLFTLGTPHEGAGQPGLVSAGGLAERLTDDVLNTFALTLGFGPVWHYSNTTVQWLVAGNPHLATLNVPAVVRATVPHPFCIAGDKHPMLGVLRIDSYSPSAALLYRTTKNDGIVAATSARATSVFGTIPTYQHRTANLNHSELLDDREIHRVLEQEARRNLGVGGSTGTGGGTDGGGTDGGGDGGSGTGGDGGGTDGGGDGGTPPWEDRAIERVSVSSSGVQGNEESRLAGSYLLLSEDGRFVAFGSDASNLVDGDSNGKSDMFVRDRHAGLTTRVSVSTSGFEGNGNSSPAGISVDGRFVGFHSNASNLIDGETTPHPELYTHDSHTNTTTKFLDNTIVQLSWHTGRFAVEIYHGGSNGVAHVFFIDIQTGGIRTQVSVSSSGVEANGNCYDAAISRNGRVVAFSSEASNLVEGDTNGVRDVFVHDRHTGNTTRVSQNSTGVQGNGYSSGPSISADGRFVVFWSDASNLVEGDTNGVSDVFVHDRQTGITARVSVSSSGGQGNYGSGSASISADGRFVAFDSRASNLVEGDTNGTYDVFVARNPLAP